MRRKLNDEEIGYIRAVDLVKGFLIGFLKRYLKKYVSKLLLRRASRLYKLRLFLVKLLDKTWIALRRLLCDPKCWELTEVELKEMIDRELLKARLRLLKGS